MDVDSFPPVYKPALSTFRTNIEAPRPRNASRNATYTLRSSPLAGPAIAISSPSNDITQCIEENTKAVDFEKTRTGATPSRISSLYPTPPSSLRGIPLSRTPSPTRSEVSSQSSASSNTSFSTPPSPVLLPATPAAARTRPRSQGRLHEELPLRGRPSAPNSPPSSFEYPASAAPFTSPDVTRNWFTNTAPPPFSRVRSAGVIMPVKASAKRPKTAPAATGARNVDRQAVATLPQKKHEYRMEPISLNEEPNEYRNLPSAHRTRSLSRPGISSVGTPVKRKQRRPRSLVTLSSRPTLGEVREEHEREGEGESESSSERTTHGDEQPVEKNASVIFPGLVMKDERRNSSAVVPENPKKATGWIKRWKDSLKRLKNCL